MPFRKKYRRKTKRKPKRYRGKRKPKATSPNYARMSTPFPKTISTKLNYRERIQVNPAALAYEYSYNANSLYDPNRTGTGHQPMFFDQLCNGTQYKRYKVRGCKWRFIISGCNTPIRYAVSQIQNTNAVADVDDLAEIKGAKSGVINTMSNGGHNVRTISGYCSIRKTVGAAIYKDVNNQAVYNSNPSTVVQLMLKFESLDGATNMTSLNIISQLVYYCDIFDIIPRTGS